VLIVTYHAIVGPSSPVCCPPAQLDADLTTLVDAGFAFVSLDECADWLSGIKQLPARSIAVTFDDAYASVVSAALPMLTRLRVPATIFVIGERIGGDNQWPGQWKSIPSMPLADASQLRALIDGGITIGSHSWSHALLTRLDPDSLHREVEQSADRLERMLGTPIRHFAYPYGHRGDREVAAARQRFRTAVNAEARLITAGADPHDLFRIDCHDLRVAMRLKLIDDVTIQPYLALRRGLRGARRGVEALLNLR
jgi:peptidoglycan/xylan/chitin deacetylase (PgdA/CDA1 family)